MPFKYLHIQTALILSFLASLLACNAQQKKKDNNPQATKETSSIGTPVSALGERIFTIYHDKNGHHWFGGDSKGVYRYNGSELVLIDTSDGLCSNEVLGFQEDQNGHLYFDSPDCICKYDGKEFSTLTISKDSTKNTSWRLNPNDLWFRMGWDHSGPFRYDGTSLHALKFPKSPEAAKFYEKYPNVSYNPYGIYTMYRDSHANIWFGTSSLGIAYYDGKKLSWYYEDQLTNTPSGGAFGIRSIIEDNDHNLWFCNPNFRYKLSVTDSINSPKPALLTKDKGLELNTDETPYFMSMTKDKLGNLWMVSYSEGVYRKQKETLFHYPVKSDGKQITIFSIYTDNDGTIWLGTHQNGAYQFNGHNFEKFEPFR